MKSLFLLPVLWVWVLSTDAQFLKFGVKAGANLEKISGVPFKEGYNLGYYGGAFTEIRMGDKWFLQPEVQFGQTELAYSEEFKDIYENILDINSLKALKLKRLSIPVSLNYKIANILSLTAGPQFSVIIDNGNSFWENAGKAFSDGDIGLMTGANIHVGKLRLNGRYIWGMKDMGRIEGASEWKAQTAQIGIGFVL